MLDSFSPPASPPGSATAFSPSASPTSAPAATPNRAATPARARNTSTTRNAAASFRWPRTPANGLFHQIAAPAPQGNSTSPTNAPPKKSPNSSSNSATNPFGKTRSSAHDPNLRPKYHHRQRPKNSRRAPLLHRKLPHR